MVPISAGSTPVAVTWINMTLIDFIIIILAILLSYLIGRWSTQGNSWESAAKTYLKLVEVWQKRAQEWETIASQEKTKNNVTN